jgi:septal ring-binding cell division protein DamX
VSATETPTPPTQVERRCPRCGAHLSAEQEWCLECGAAVGTRIAEPRGWRVPIAIVGTLLALALIAAILAIVELAGPAEQVTEVPQTPTPAPATATPAPSTTPDQAGTTPTPSATPSATPTPNTANLAKWPAGKSAWTIVINSSGTREDAERLAGEVAAKGVPGVGVLDSNDFESLGPDSFVVFSGQYATRALADEALAQLRDRAGGGSTRQIVPKKG